MKVCTTLLLPSLLCSILPIARTPAHCSLASCQTWFLTPASSLPLFLLCCHAATPRPHLSFWVSPSVPLLCLCMCVCACARARDSSGMPLSPFLHSCFLRFFLISTSICSWHVNTLLWYQTSTGGCELDSHIAARSQVRACWNRDCCTRFRRSKSKNIPTRLLTDSIHRDTPVFWCQQCKRKDDTNNVAHLHFTSKCGSRWKNARWKLGERGESERRRWCEGKRAMTDEDLNYFMVTALKRDCSASLLMETAILPSVSRAHTLWSRFNASFCSGKTPRTLPFLWCFRGLTRSHFQIQSLRSQSLYFSVFFFRLTVC